MRRVELIADGNVISYMFKRTPLGDAYTELIDSRLTGITLPPNPHILEEHYPPAPPYHAEPLCVRRILTKMIVVNLNASSG